MLMKAWTPVAAGILVMAVSASLTTQASAQAFDRWKSCVTGVVPANDWAELSQNFHESRRDTMARLYLSTDDYIEDAEQPVLRVLDPDGNSVCVNTAEPKSRCDWPINDRLFFDVRVDNTARSQQTKYRLCAD